MDLSFIHKNQETVAKSKLNDFDDHLYKFTENYDETDVNEKICSFKTDQLNLTLNDSMENENLEMDSLFSYSSFKTAMDLSIHNRSDEKKRTIFEDADYFSRNYLYKLLPITFENVDETIIHTEHNYCNSFMSSESEAEEDCSRTMDYTQIKEKNYKRRKVKANENGIKPEKSDIEEHQSIVPSSSPPQENHNSEEIYSDALQSLNHSTSTSDCIEEPIQQPLDLSPPLVQEQKTDNHIRENQPSPKDNLEEKEDFDSDKENLKSKPGGIEVTISRPDEKENYQPCDMFLNDIASLVPRLIGKDCFEVDILDKTCSKFDTNHRFYYIVPESSWQLFQNANKRVILTNDSSLGQPVQEKEEKSAGKPSFLVFDRVSLPQWLSDYCKETGGSFEYTSVEERVNDEREVECGDQVKEGEIEKSEANHSPEMFRKYLNLQLEKALSVKMDKAKPNESTEKILEFTPEKTAEVMKFGTIEETKDLKETVKTDSVTVKEVKDSIKSVKPAKNIKKTKRRTRKMSELDEQLTKGKTEGVKSKKAVIETSDKEKELIESQEKLKSTLDEEQKIKHEVVANILKTYEKGMKAPKCASGRKKWKRGGLSYEEIIKVDEIRDLEKENNLENKRKDSGGFEKVQSVKNSKNNSQKVRKAKDTKSDVKNVKEEKDSESNSEKVKSIRNISKNSSKVKSVKYSEKKSEKVRSVNDSDSDFKENKKAKEIKNEVDKDKDAKTQSGNVGNVKRTLKKTTKKTEVEKKMEEMIKKDLAEEKRRSLRAEKESAQTIPKSVSKVAERRRNQTYSENVKPVTSEIRTRSKSISEIPSQNSNKRKVSVKPEPSKKPKQEVERDMITRSGKKLAGRKSEVEESQGLRSGSKRSSEGTPKVAEKRKKR